MFYSIQNISVLNWSSPPPPRDTTKYYQTAIQLELTTNSVGQCIMMHANPTTEIFFFRTRRAKTHEDSDLVCILDLEISIPLCNPELESFSVFVVITQTIHLYVQKYQ